MQFITRLLFHYNISISLITLISIFLTWFPLVILAIFSLLRKGRLSQEKQEKLFGALALLPLWLLGIQSLLLGRQFWQLWHNAGGQAFYHPALNALEHASVYLALPGGFIGIFCGFLIFDVSWNSRKFWMGFWGYTSLSLISLAGHLSLAQISFQFVQFGLADMLSLWSSYYLAGIPLVLLMMAIAVIFNPGILRSAERMRTASLKSERSDFAH